MKSVLAADDGDGDGVDERHFAEAIATKMQYGFAPIAYCPKSDYMAEAGFAETCLPYYSMEGGSDCGSRSGFPDGNPRTFWWSWWWL